MKNLDMLEIKIMNWHLLKIRIYFVIYLLKLGYSFEDSMSEDDDSDEDARIKQKELKEAKVFVPKNF